MCSIFFTSGLMKMTTTLLQPRFSLASTTALCNSHTILWGGTCPMKVAIIRVRSRFSPTSTATFCNANTKRRELLHFPDRCHLVHREFMSRQATLHPLLARSCFAYYRRRLCPFFCHKILMHHTRIAEHYLP